MRWVLELQSSGTCCYVVWWTDTNVPEELAVSIFGEEDRNERRKIAAWYRNEKNGA